MKFRVLYSKCPKHIRCYQERGITICDEWMRDATKFDKWALENGWAPGLQIDRKDNKGDYRPSNCRFVTCAENNQNKRNNVVTKSQVAEIRARFIPRTDYVALAAQYGLTPRQVNYIRCSTNPRYRHLDDAAVKAIRGVPTSNIAALAKEYGVSERHIYSIVTQKVWKD